MFYKKKTFKLCTIYLTYAINLVTNIVTQKSTIIFINLYYIFTLNYIINKCLK